MNTLNTFYRIGFLNFVRLLNVLLVAMLMLIPLTMIYHAVG
ncbi:hypothetical protein ABN763_04630 [Spongiivirga sp. MCCC 1A20706]